MASDPPAEGNFTRSPRVWLTLADDVAGAFERLLTVRGYDAESVDLGNPVQEGALPDVWLLDARTEGAPQSLVELRARDGGPKVDVVFLGGTPLPENLKDEASGAFQSGTDPETVVRKIDALCGLASIPPRQGPQVSTVPPAGSREQRGTSKDTAAPDEDAEGPKENPAPSEDTNAPSERERAPAEEGGDQSAADAPSTPGQRPGAFIDDDPSHPSLPAPVPLGFSNEDAGPRQVPQSEMSPELESLLARAEQRVSALSSGDSLRPTAPKLSPDEEIEAVLPAEVLAALDEPLDLDDDDKLGSAEDSEHGTRSGSGARTGFGTNIGTGAGSYGGGGATGQGTAASGQGTGLGTFAGSPLSSPGTIDGGVTTGAEPTAPPPQQRSSQSEPPQTAAALPPSDAEPRPPSWPPAPANAMVTAIEARPQTGPPSTPAATARPAPSRPLEPPRPIAPMTAAPRITFSDERSQEPPQEAASTPQIPAVLSAGDALKVLAQAVQSRFTGAIAFEDPAGIRRVVFRDGDFVIAASGANTESLMAFLIERGVLGPEVAQRLGPRIPPFGRYAGAALIANGHLRQDELWPVLRAHAEWVVGRIMLMEGGGASIEREVPPRLQAEPAVFGGATGAEVLVEVARRVVLPEAAVTQLGGQSGVLTPGESHNLLSECALTDAETALVEQASGSTLGEVLNQIRDPGFTPMFAALVALRVLQVDSGQQRRSGAQEPPPQKWDALDESAVRQRILARRALVDEGDYFSLLGVPRRATSYDVRRAYAELRRDFEPSRMLTPGCADLKDDVDLIVEVLEEAYEILRDNLRRERYRRALESVPTSG